jgi:hypothetical protein
MASSALTKASGGFVLPPEGFPTQVVDGSVRHGEGGTDITRDYPAGGFDQRCLHRQAGVEQVSHESIVNVTGPGSRHLAVAVVARQHPDHTSLPQTHSHRDLRPWQPSADLPD